MNGELIFTICYGGMAVFVGVYANWVLKKEFDSYVSKKENYTKGVNA